MADHRKDEVEKGITATRWCILTLMDLLSEFDKAEIGEGSDFGLLYNGLDQILEELDGIWEEFCGSRE